MKNQPIEKVFQKRTPEEKENDLKESTRLLNVTAARARACLNNPDFIQFKQDYIAAEARVLNDMIAYTDAYVASPNGDVVKYAFTILRLITRLKDYRSLISKVDVPEVKKPAEKEATSA